jgi:hypothetical protein
MKNRIRFILKDKPSYLPKEKQVEVLPLSQINKILPKPIFGIKRLSVQRFSIKSKDI